MERLVVVWCPSLLIEGERGSEARRFIEVLDAAGELCPWVEPVRSGVCALPAKGPSRFFGGERMLVQRLAGAVGALGPGPEGPGVLGATQARIGVADGLYAALLASQSELIVPKGGTAEFLSQWSVAVLQRPELGVTLQRLGIHTLGQFATLPVSDVEARFGADAAACQRVARGREGELPGMRDPGIARRLQEVSGLAPAPTRQGTFFGGASAAERRAEASFARVQRRLGPDALLVASLQGGRDPADRVQLVPWGGRDPRVDQRGEQRPGRPGSRRGSAPPVAPWPGRLPPPSPVIVPAVPTPVELVDAEQTSVGVTGRGLLTAEPVHCSVEGAPWQEVVAWAGPWPAVERWWSSRRRRARLQVVTATGVALLLVVAGERWWLAGLYD
ncbi:MAG TPA: hypothetical protein VMB82_05270 [Acidimicrobiales bacterium]|nr:hypothetical protein [Acidimicrobiales bacterium]